MSSIAQVILTVTYPALIMLALSRFEPRGVAIVVLGVLALRLVALCFGSAPGSHARPPASLLLSIVVVGAVVFATVIRNDPIGLLAAPVLVNLALLVSFAFSLRGVSIVEKLARLQVDRLSRAEIRYCRRVTSIWCGFFALNGAVALTLALRRDLAAWTFYTGFLAYVLMGLLFAAEFVYRHARFRRYAGSPTDPLMRSLFPPGFTPEFGEIDASGGAERRLVQIEVPTGLACWPGHFTGEQTLPGVVQVDWALRAIEMWRRARARLSVIEALELVLPVLPGDELVLELEAESATGRISFSYRRDDEIVSRGRIGYAEHASSTASPVGRSGTGGIAGARVSPATAWPDPRELLAHTGQMVWLRAVERHDAHETACLVAVADLWTFRRPGAGVGAHAALEWMTQCVAAHLGLERRLCGQAPRRGLLLGSECIRFARSAYNRDESFRVVAVHDSGGDPGLASFDCRIESIPTGECIAQARISYSTLGAEPATPSEPIATDREENGMESPSERAIVGSRASPR